MTTTGPSPADMLGFDAFLDEDISPNGRSATGAELVANAIPHRLMADTIPLIGAPNGVKEFGVNVRRWVGEPLTFRPDGTSPELDAKVAQIDAALHRDPRIAQNQIVLTKAPAGSTLTDGSQAQILITITSTLVTGVTVSRVVGVSAVSVGFLASE
jgi:hypothetical protein